MCLKCELGLTDREYAHHLRRLVDKQDWIILHLDDESLFYTVGFTGRAMPELVLFNSGNNAVRIEDAARVLNELGERQFMSGAFTAGQWTQVGGVLIRLDEHTAMGSLPMVPHVYPGGGPQPPALSVALNPEP